jgi:hypothetical protein
MQNLKTNKIMERFLEIMAISIPLWLIASKLDSILQQLKNK